MELFVDERMQLGRWCRVIAFAVVEVVDLNRPESIINQSKLF